MHFVQNSFSTNKNHYTLRLTLDDDTILVTIEECHDEFNVRASLNGEPYYTDTYIMQYQNFSHMLNYLFGCALDKCILPLAKNQFKLLYTKENPSLLDNHTVLYFGDHAIWCYGYKKEGAPVQNVTIFTRNDMQAFWIQPTTIPINTYFDLICAVKNEWRKRHSASFSDFIQQAS